MLLSINASLSPDLFIFVELLALNSRSLTFDAVCISAAAGHVLVHHELEVIVLQIVGHSLMQCAGRVGVLVCC
jgi:hypothetical protein